MPDQPNAALAQEIRDQDYIEEYIKAVERGGGSWLYTRPTAEMVAEIFRRMCGRIVEARDALNETRTREG